MSNYGFNAPSPPNFSYHIIDTDVELVIPQFQQMIVCGTLCMRDNSFLTIGPEAMVAII